MKNSLISHAAFACAAALFASCVTYVTLAGWPEWMSPSLTHAQARPNPGTRQTERFRTAMGAGRVVGVRAADGDAADDLAAGHDRQPALDRRGSDGHENHATLDDRVLESFGRTAQHRRRLGLVERNLHAPGLRVVHALVVDE